MAIIAGTSTIIAGTSTIIAGTSTIITGTQQLLLALQFAIANEKDVKFLHVRIQIENRFKKFIHQILTIEKL